MTPRRINKFVIQSRIKRDLIPEFLGQIIDVFEDFLEEKGIEIPNEERDDSDNPAIIYGTDYGNLSDDLEALMNAWDVTERRW